MKARHVARELALLSFSQLSKDPEDQDFDTLEDLIIGATRTLNDYASANLKDTITDLLNVKEYLDDLELNDPVNLERPIEARLLPVKMPDTKKLKEIIDALLESAEYIMHSAEVSEISALSEKEEVKIFSIKILQTYQKNKSEVDKIIRQYSEGWNIDRLHKIDRNILRIAITEISHFDDIPAAVAVDEAIELAKKYSSDESPKFINGLLGQYLSSLHVATLET
jgi:N utilization substance protein B